MVTGAAAQERCCGWPAIEATRPALGRRDDPDSAIGVLGRQRVRLRNANVGNQCTVTGRLVVFTMVGQEPLRCPGSAWAAGAARW
jgi:hypothetical protein